MSESRDPLTFCRALGCSTRVPKPRLFCQVHYSKVPDELRAGLTAAHGTRDWEDAVDGVVSHVACAEGYQRKRK